jgi:hypothetical protein
MYQSYAFSRPFSISLLGCPTRHSGAGIGSGVVDVDYSDYGLGFLASLLTPNAISQLLAYCEKTLSQLVLACCVGGVA